MGHISWNVRTTLLPYLRPVLTNLSALIALFMSLGPSADLRANFVGAPRDLFEGS